MIEQSTKWLVIAKNEYRIITSGMGKSRTFLPIIVIVFLAILILFIFPMIIEFFVDDLQAFFLSITALAMVEIVLFMFFFWLLLTPITYTLREEDTNELEIFLSAPIKPSDVLLGKFMGFFPFYAIFIAIVTGIFTAILTPLGIDWVQTLIIIMIFVLILVSALWIGTVIAAILKTKLAKSARGKDIGKALALLIALPMVAIMYAIMGGGLFEALADPNTNNTVKTIFALFPSSWGAEVIIAYALHPGDIGAVWLETLIGLGGVILFFILSLWIGTKVADRAYSLEQTSFSGASAKPDGAFYRSMKNIAGGGSFGTILVSMFKEYTRRLENLSYMMYFIGIFVLLNIFFYDNENASDVLFSNSFFLPMLAGLAASDLALRGKETLFIYRKAPNGESRFINIMLIRGWLMVIPLIGLIMIISISLTPNINIKELIMYTGFAILITAAQVAFALGLFLLLPAPADNQRSKNATLWTGIMVVMFVSMFLFIFSLIIYGGEIGLLLMYTPTMWLLGFLFLYFGKLRLSRIE